MLPNIFKEHLFLGNVVTDESMNSTASTELSASISDVDELESADVGNTTCAGFSDDDGIMASPLVVLKSPLKQGQKLVVV